MGNKSQVDVLGKGSFVLEFTSKKCLTLNDVYHAPALRKNLLFGYLLNKYGFKKVYESGNFIMSKASIFVGKRSKDEVLDNFKVFKTEVKLHYETSMKCLMSDRAGEYYNPSYFQSYDIVHQVSAPYTLQQNSVAERKNQVLTEIMNAMLSNSGLSHGYWGEAMKTSCWILNRVRTKQQKSTTPYEL
ncbi:hypothetical protein LIER_35819 [Lithospermum erythrorhizon]|uniref:Integrase catalytic domain-containing protein n=1 Tax=Lithospermum erythrorhizon TaxID=34254 RepID=A0AAV3NYL7_LITER